MKNFKDLVSKDKVSGFESSARKYMENQKWMDKSFDIALLIIARVNELGWTKQTLIEKSTLPTNKIIEILSGRADLTLSEITKLEEVLNIQLIKVEL
jgi:ribosome-binding protein aMBF1 (putative translation factor)